MNESNLMMESLQLMAIGMGIVFSFLLLLVVVLRLMSWVALRVAPAEPHPRATSLVSPEGQPDDLIAVISAAVAQYRARH